MNFKKLLSSLGLTSIGSFAYSFDIEPFFGFGLANEPVIPNYTIIEYVDGSTQQLVAGSGFGVLIGSDIVTRDGLTLDIRVGAQFTTMDAEDTDGNGFNTSFYHFPVLANYTFNITRRISLSAGASILLAPTVQYTYEPAYDDTVYFKGKTSYGYNTELRYHAIPPDPDKDVEAFYVLRYMNNTIEFNEFTGETLSASYKTKLESIQLGLKIRY